VLIRTDGAGGTHGFLTWVTGQRLQYSVGFGLTQTAVTKIDLIPQSAWKPAYDADGSPRDGAWVTELTGLLDLSDWPDGMRVIVRAERPHPRRPAEVHRLGREPVDRVRDEHQTRATPGPGTAAPAPRPLRGPDPERQEHRPEKPSAA
jgi:hypothetical protein